jgi:hypothetical protein
MNAPLVRTLFSLTFPIAILVGVPLAGCTSDEGAATPENDGGLAGDGALATDAGDAGPAVCPAPMPPTARTAVSAPTSTVVPLPADIATTSMRNLDGTGFPFRLTRTSQVKVALACLDCVDTQEKTSIVVDVVLRTIQAGKGVLHASVSPSTPTSAATSKWLYPGDYEVQTLRTTYASAAVKDDVPHRYTVAIDVTEAPVADGTCTEPPAATDDVRGRGACNAFCEAIAAFGYTCEVNNDCAIPAGQCAASIEASLRCKTKNDLQCVSAQGKVVGTSWGPAACKPDASLCGR